MITILGHTIRPEAVDYISSVEKVITMSNSTYYFTLTLFLRGQKLVLQNDAKDALEKNRLDILNAMAYSKGTGMGYAGG